MSFVNKVFYISHSQWENRFHLHSVSQLIKDQCFYCFIDRLVFYGIVRFKPDSLDLDQSPMEVDIVVCNVVFCYWYPFFKLPISRLFEEFKYKIRIFFQPSLFYLISTAFDNYNDVPHTSRWHNYYIH